MGSVDDILSNRTRNRERLQREAPDLLEGFSEMVKRYYKIGALERKHKELVAVTAARQEVLEAASIGVEFGGRPSFVAVGDNLPYFLDEIEAS